MNELPAPLPSADDGPRRRPYSSALGLACLDGSALIISWFLVVSLFGRVWGGEFLVLLPTLVIGQLSLGYLLSLYRNRYQLGLRPANCEIRVWLPASSSPAPL